MPSRHGAGNGRRHGFDDGAIREEVSADWSGRRLERVHLPLPEARRILEEWRANPAARRY
jgi:hypothetical protein